MFWIELWTRLQAAWCWFTCSYPPGQDTACSLDTLENTERQTIQDVDDYDDHSV